MIYLDYQATTPMAPEAKAAMMPWLDGGANPHSSHRIGRKAAAAVAIAEEQIAALLPNAEDGHLIFTSGATESLNWAIKGLWLSNRNKRCKVVTLETEHAATLDSVRYLEKLGAEVIFLPVHKNGLVDMERAAAEIDADTALVTAMLVNNEIGVIQPIAELAALAHNVGAYFLLDAVQGYGRVGMPETCDMIALSAHKIHGPIGVGALWFKKNIALQPLFHGGHQQGGLRSGTLSPALCAGFGAAAFLARQKQAEDFAYISELFAVAKAEMPDWIINGSEDIRWPGNFNIHQEGIDSSRLISDTRQVAFSAGSACSSGNGRPSHVLRALDLSQKAVRGSIRIGFGRYTTREDLVTGLGYIREAAEKQRKSHFFS